MRPRAWIGVLSVVLACLLAETARAQPQRRGRGPGRWAAPLKVGDAVPDFALKDVEGNTVKASDFKGKSILVLEFGACT